MLHRSALQVIFLLAFLPSMQAAHSKKEDKTTHFIFSKKAIQRPEHLTMWDVRSRIKRGDAAITGRDEIASPEASCP